MYLFQYLFSTVACKVMDTPEQVIPLLQPCLSYAQRLEWQSSSNTNECNSVHMVTEDVAVDKRFRAHMSASHFQHTRTYGMS
jgi:hypothetical protein